MLIARQKRSENIAEYILYMWQVEDIIRANNFSLEKIEETVIKGFKQPDDIKEQIKDWYADLIIMMKEEGITKTGHLKQIKDVVNEVEDFHKKLLKKKDEDKYVGVYSWAKPNIDALKAKINENTMGDVNTCLTALYGLLLMRLKKKEITEETNEAMTTFSNFIALLAGKFKQFEEGKLEV
jgi:flagellin-specific chaperone FliS